MFVLRDEHLEAFRRAGLDRFNRRAVGRLRADHPAVTSTLSDDELLGRCRAWNPEARRLGFRTDAQSLRYYAARLYLASSDPPAPVRPPAGDPEGGSVAYLAAARRVWELYGRSTGGG